MKMTYVADPTTFISGLGQYSASEMLHGLSWLASTDQDLMAGHTGLGQLSQNASVMDAIIRNAAEYNVKTSIVTKARAEAAKKNPAFSMKLNAAMKKVQAPGTNVAAAVIGASQDAAAKAMQAKVLEAKAKALMHDGDLRAAAAQSANALTAARDAMTLANKAEKTRLTSAMQQVAHTLDSQASYVDSQVASETSRSGASKRTDGLRAAGMQLRSQAQKLRQQAGVVQASPDVPPGAPTQKRIAEVMNKFNLRSVGRGADSVLSVLSDLADSALAQVKDYDGALMFYGNDSVGRLMCDIEFADKGAAVKGLAHGVHGIGKMELTPLLAQSDAVLAQGVYSAQQGFQQAVLPAFVGKQKGLGQMKNVASVLSGIGDLGRPYAFTVSAEEADKWDRVCTEEYGPNGKTPDDDQLQKCLKPKAGCDFFQPWEAVGRACRGNITIGAAIAQAGAAIIKGDVKVPDVGAMVGGGKTPPGDTLPPRTIPSGGKTFGGAINSGRSAVVNQQAATTQAYAQPNYSYAAAVPSNTMLYGAIGAGALVLGTAVYWTMFRRPSAA